MTEVFFMFLLQYTLLENLLYAIVSFSIFWCLVFLVILMWNICVICAVVESELLGGSYDKVSSD